MTTWYVRPTGGPYGAANGTTYADAWAGWVSIVWNGAGILPNDTLYVCDTHSYGASITTGNCNSVAGTEPTIRGDYTGHPGVLGFTAGSLTLNASRSYYKYLNLTLDGGGVLSSSLFMNCSVGSSVLGSGLTFTNVTMQNGVYVSITGNNGMYYNALSFINCSISDARYGIQYLAGAVNQYYNTGISNITITGCIFSNISSTAGTGCGIELRNMGDTYCNPGGCYIRNLVITNNTFTNVGIGTGGGGPIRVITNNTSKTNSYGCVITGNTANNCGNAANINGGNAVSGFGSLTKSYASRENVISNNTMTNIMGAWGGFDLFYSSYFVIENNTIDGMTNPTGQDADGILIDINNDHVVVRNNTVKNCFGGAINTGAGIMVLSSTYIYVYNNYIQNCNHGFWAWSDTYCGATWCFNNTFTNIVNDGIHMQGLPNKGLIHIHNNNFNGARYFYWNDAGITQNVDIQGNTQSGFGTYSNTLLANQVPGHVLGYLYVNAITDYEVTPKIIAVMDHPEQLI